MLINKEASGFKNRQDSLFFTKSCRDAIKQILINGSGAKRILIPAYVGLSLEEGSGILDPINESDTEFQFYDLDSHLDPDLASVRLMMSVFAPTHVLLVNYFGFLTNNRDEVFKLLSRHSVCIIEDFAHLIEPMYAVRQIPRLADFEVVSLHKTIASGTGGGALLCKSANFDFVETISLESLRHFAKADLDYISKARWRNYEYLQTNINSLNCDYIQPFFSDGRRPISPLNFPIRLPNLDLRHKLYEYLVAAGVFPTALYHRLVEELNSDRYSSALDISQRILNLPTHQDIQVYELGVMAKILKDFCNDN
jgi:dTDP-4-amino-4,6-dideoxygalactose transaminase